MAKQKRSKDNNETLQNRYQGCPRASFFRRLGAYIYDLFAIAAVLMVAGIFAILVVILGNKIGLIGLEGYQDVAAYLAQSTLFALYLALVMVGFYGYFWTKAGQTLGMKAWRLKLVSNDNLIISYKNAFIRFISSFFGLANFGVLLPGKRGWHDRLSHTDIVVIDKND